jgi:hypothetical protein
MVGSWGSTPWPGAQFTHFLPFNPLSNMAELAEKPKTTKAIKLLASYAEVTEKKSKLTDKYKDDCTPLDEKLAALKGKLDAEFTILAAAGALGNKKSLLLDAGTIGVRLGAKAIAFPLDGPEDIQIKYQALVKRLVPSALTEVVDSKKVLGALAHFPDLEKGLAKLGIQVKQEESFFITLKK